MSIGFEKITITGPIADFPSDPNFSVGFNGCAAAVLYTVADGAEVEVSFDGRNVHALLRAGTAGASVFCGAGNYRSVWLRSTYTGELEVGVGFESTGIK